MPLPHTFSQANTPKKYPIFLYKSNSSLNEFPEVSLYNLSFYKIFPSCIQLKYQRSICINPPHCILKYKPDFVMEVCNNIEILTFYKPLHTLH